MSHAVLLVFSAAWACLLLPFASGLRTRRGDGDLVLTHVPYNFGHTIENVAIFGGGSGSKNVVAVLQQVGGLGGKIGWDAMNQITQNRSKAELWGHFHPDLQETSNITGCPMYFTPPKHWPVELAQRYFGNKTIFGMLRDPYERLVAQFRGNVANYGGGTSDDLIKACDVNSGIKAMMKRYLESGNKYAQGCTFVPQAEYFEGDYGIKLAVDNRRFPKSMNEVFHDHGYDHMKIKINDIMHVTNCPDVWAEDLDNETRALVRQVYSEDFKLLCSRFGYCDQEENTCIPQVPQMCPMKAIRRELLKQNIDPEAAFKPFVANLLKGETS